MRDKLLILCIFLCCFHVALNDNGETVSRMFNLVKKDGIPDATALETHTATSVIACLASCKDECQSVNFGEHTCVLFADIYKSDADVWKEVKGMSHYEVKLPEVNKITTTEPTTTSEATTTQEVTTTLPETTTVITCATYEEETCDEIAVKFDIEFISDKKTFEDAQDACAKKNKKLVKVNSKRKFNCVNEFLTKLKCPGNVWIGLKWNEDEKNYQWSNQVRLLDNCQFWAYGEPNNKGNTDGECAFLWKDKGWRWADSSCTDIFYVVCEK